MSLTDDYDVGCCCCADYCDIDNGCICDGSEHIDDLDICNDSSERICNCIAVGDGSNGAPSLDAIVHDADQCGDHEGFQN
jgi:hypothetical protein